MVVLPAETANDVARKRWGLGSQEEIGFMEMKVVSADASLASLNTAYPKLAALAGFAKDRKVPKGWLTFNNGILRICKGKSNSPKNSHVPKKTAFIGRRQHEPQDDAGVLFTHEMDAGST